MELEDYFKQPFGTSFVLSPSRCPQQISAPWLAGIQEVHPPILAPSKLQRDASKGATSRFLLNLCNVVRKGLGSLQDT